MPHHHLLAPQLQSLPSSQSVAAALLCESERRCLAHANALPCPTTRAKQWAMLTLHLYFSLTRLNGGLLNKRLNCSAISAIMKKNQSMNSTVNFFHLIRLIGWGRLRLITTVLCRYWFPTVHVTVLSYRYCRVLWHLSHFTVPDATAYIFLSTGEDPDAHLWSSSSVRARRSKRDREPEHLRSRRGLRMLQRPQKLSPRALRITRNFGSGNSDF
jgi:hypothetical protein